MSRPSRRNRSSWATRTGLRRLCISTIMIPQATPRETRVARATPATPMENPKTRMALPTTFRPFIRAETYMEARELPMDRSKAAHPL